MNGCIKAVVLWLSLSSAVYAERLPDFIVILTDDQGWGTTSVEMDPVGSKNSNEHFGR